ncbi:transmembrane protein [Rhynchospora pubera]|uniref:Transmembrane protein n=2 Tax=Rhynchospora pubera TaxID=906938 RepID=A0AAV8G4Z8_9POAL|nr:transmembrane protein [Rhynchospora pubera]
MGFASSSSNPSLYHTRKAFLLSNYILLGAASGCIFLTLSLRLIPSLCGLLLIFLHCLTAVSAGFSCSVGPAASHMAQTAISSLTAIFQGAVALLALTRTSDFLTELKSYVREDDAEVILKMVGALGLLVFVLAWVVLALAFVIRLEGEGDGMQGSNVRSSKVGNEEHLKDWPWPFQV